MCSLCYVIVNKLDIYFCFYLYKRYVEKPFLLLKAKVSYKKKTCTRIYINLVIKRYLKTWKYRKSVNQVAVSLALLYTSRTILSSKDLINKSTDQQALTLRTFPYYEAFTPLHRRRNALRLSCEYQCLVVSGAKNAGVIGCLTLIVVSRSRFSQDSRWSNARVNGFVLVQRPLLAYARRTFNIILWVCCYCFLLMIIFTGY